MVHVPQPFRSLGALITIAASLALAACNEGTSDSSAAASSTGTVAAVAALTLVGAPPTEVTVDDNYFFQAYASNGAGGLSYAASGMPAWLRLDSATGILSGTPSSADIGTTNDIVLTATTPGAAGSIGPFRVSVKTRVAAAASVPASNLPPLISGTPPATVRAGQAYTFTPSASDPEGATLAYSIANRPGWASFDTATGKLSGTPGSEWRGSFPDILIRVSDGSVSTALPAFTVDVTDAAPVAPTPGASTPNSTPNNAPNSTPNSTPNSSPLISGTPSSSATVGVSYTFNPVASDAEGDPLTFSIQNKPVWSSFSTTTGKLTGTPTTGNMGTYDNVVITVSDGKLSRSLAPFTIMVAQVAQPSGAAGTAMVSWSPPLLNVDGSMLTDLTGFNIYYGQDPANLNRLYELDCSWCLSHLLDNLGPGTWYFAVKAYNKYGFESNYSALASKTIVF